MKKYDVIIIGGGFAGLACCIHLVQHGMSCLIVEKNNDLSGKVCGDALTVSALTYLKMINIDPIAIEGKKVFSKIIYRDGAHKELFFSELFGMDFEFGVSRDILINYILDYALVNGAVVAWNHECRNITHMNKGYCVDGVYYASEIVLASGVTGRRIIQKSLPKDLPMGISARIQGKCGYSNESFHYFYNNCYGDGYAWLFPIGKDMWNVGVYGCERKHIKQLYYNFEKELFDDNREFEYLRKPKGAFVGATKEIVCNNSPFWFVGDCAFSSNYETGEGISFAIRDGITVAEKIMEKRRE